MVNNVDFGMAENMCDINFVRTDILCPSKFTEGVGWSIRSL